jgi:hypothetical protein
MRSYRFYLAFDPERNRAYGYVPTAIPAGAEVEIIPLTDLPAGEYQVFYPFGEDARAHSFLMDRMHECLERGLGQSANSVLVLGKDTGPALDRLKGIATRLGELGYHTSIIKEEPDLPGESIVQKVMRYAVRSRFVLIENTEPAGHLYEIPHVTKMAECVTVVLQEEGKGATWMFEDAYAKHKHWHKITYKGRDLNQAVELAAKWAEEFVADFAQYQVEHLPWRSEKVYVQVVDADGKPWTPSAAPVGS